MKNFLVVMLVLGCMSCGKKEDPPEPVIFQEPNIVYIYSVTATPTDSESITLKNNSGVTVNIGGWTLGDLNNSTAYNIPSNTILTQGQTIFFSHTTLGFQINDSGETIYLKNAETSIDTWNN